MNENLDLERIQISMSEQKRSLALLNRYMVTMRHSQLDLIHSALPQRQEIECIVCCHKARLSSFQKHHDICQFGGGKLERYFCDRCDTLFGAKKILDMTAEELGLEYELLYDTYKESDCTQLELRTFRSMGAKPGSLVINWGCGVWADTIKILRDEGYNIYGFEPNIEKSTDQILKHRAEISAKFDYIFSNNVIEHLVDPVAAFKDMHSILKTGGIMAHSSPCYEISYTNTRFHTFFPLGKSMEILCERSGFEVVSKEFDGEYRNFILRAV